MSSISYTLGKFLDTPHHEVLGKLSEFYSDLGFSSLLTSAIDAWRDQIPILQCAIRELVATRQAALGWTILLEYVLPLRDRRPDAVILAGSAVFVLEFKIGADAYDSTAMWQVQSYALDLRDFHPDCKNRAIVPILVASNARQDEFAQRTLPTELRATSLPVQLTNRFTLGTCLIHNTEVHNAATGASIDSKTWQLANYSPTPSIIEAAQALFGNHSVREISHAFSDTLETTSQAIVDAVEYSQRENCRTICFVTGIPGSGKTLVGLNAVHNPALLKNTQSCAVFLSGNGPLVKVIREAIARKKQSAGFRKGAADDIASACIGNVHGFIKLYAIKEPDKTPALNVIVFDEAQRAWSAKAVEEEHGVNRSEPAMVLDIMERVPAWSTVVALVGGGQEINKGEAGLQEWGRALAERTSKWRVLVSPEALSGGESVSGHQLFPEGATTNVDAVAVPLLDLRISVRSHRADFIGEWVNRTLSSIRGASFDARPAGDFPVVLTRDLVKARRWLNAREETCQRTGLLASSGAIRLRAYGLEVGKAFRKGVSYPDWFLRPLGDVRSSYQLEIAATEFDCQGLEIDWACVCWGGDFVIDALTGNWRHWYFKGNRWLPEKNATKQQYTVNKYRVLLTRARRGMVIWIPTGPTAAKNGEFFDATARHLVQAGVQLLD